ncbi:MAG: hypothetical protein ACLRMJ_05740 [Alistipes finegoldii]
MSRSELFRSYEDVDRKASIVERVRTNGERISMTLTDGTTVWLNSHDAGISGGFARGERRVKVTGEAMFDVKSDPR